MVTENVSLVSHDICARLHTFLLETTRPKLSEDKNSLVLKVQDDVTTIRLDILNTFIFLEKLYKYSADQTLKLLFQKSIIINFIRLHFTIQNYDKSFRKNLLKMIV